ncbi:hypothetical protein PF004_g1695 [Phytophthora fragariae]|uniref:DDE Tnp4 domain-containing protein n=1 Tax=Phytophthora fragariae TaxID=53985 RepID=A0A6G0PRK3_9STRA|nr:hypothetical protein PF004_g1695 [Phytophthora fragariae]
MAEDIDDKCVVVAAALAAAVAATHDVRRDRGPSTAVWSTRTCPWDSTIVGRSEAKWTDINSPLGSNAVFDIETRVGVTLFYLTHEGSYQVAGSFFGASKAQAIAHMDQVVAVLNSCYLESTVRLPQTLHEWHVVSIFERVCGVPNVVGAIDGSLFPVRRFADYEGWYCRKGFPAFNMQVVVDSNKRIMSFSIRSGSQNV